MNNNVIEYLILQISKGPFKQCICASLFLSSYGLMLLNYNSSASSTLEKKLCYQNNGNLRFTSNIGKKKKENLILFYLNGDMIV